MAMTPFGRMPLVRQRFIDEATNEPLSSGSLKFFVVGTSTPADVYADSEGNTSLGDDVDLDADGIAPSIFLAQHGYRLEVWSGATSPVLQTAQSGDEVEDVGATFFGNQGTFFSAGTKSAASGYAVTNDDLFITVASVANPGIVNLQAYAERTQPLWIKNVSAFAVRVTPDGSETIDTVAAYYTLPAAATPNFPTICLFPNATVAGYLIASSHGL